MEINITLIEGKDFNKDASGEQLEELCKVTKIQMEKLLQLEKIFGQINEMDVRYSRHRVIGIDKAKNKDQIFITETIPENEWDNEEDEKWDNE